MLFSNITPAQNPNDICSPYNNKKREQHRTTWGKNTAFEEEKKGDMGGWRDLAMVETIYEEEPEELSYSPSRPTPTIPPSVIFSFKRCVEAW